MSFAEFRKLPILEQMPFSTELRDSTKFMSLDTWVEKQLRERKKRLDMHSNWSEEKLQGYEQGLIDMALDAKVEIKRLNGGYKL
jgi:hypothetical protein